MLDGPEDSGYGQDDGWNTVSYYGPWYGGEWRSLTKVEPQKNPVPTKNKFESLEENQKDRQEKEEDEAGGAVKKEGRDKRVADLGVKALVPYSRYAQTRLFFVSFYVNTQMFVRIGLADRRTSACPFYIWRHFWKSVRASACVPSSIWLFSVVCYAA